MSLLISGDLKLAKSWDLAGFDADAAAYIQRVEWADTTPLESATRTAINNFVIGCKADGIWTAIKASCILAGARTLAGALMPLVGAAPTNINFVNGDYNRKNGIGDALNASKYIDANRSNAADPQNNQHMAAFQTNYVDQTIGQLIGTEGSLGLAGATHVNTYNFGGTSRGYVTRNRNSAIDVTGTVTPTRGLVGMSRNSSTSYTTRILGASTLLSRTSQTPITGNIQVFNNESAGGTFNLSSIAFILQANL